MGAGSHLPRTAAVKPRPSPAIRPMVDRGAPPSLRLVSGVTLLAETGRPAGHATILRELVHGQIGRGARPSDGLGGPPRAR